MKQTSDKFRETWVTVKSPHYRHNTNLVGIAYRQNAINDHGKQDLSRY